MPWQTLDNRQVYTNYVLLRINNVYVHWCNDKGPSNRRQAAWYMSLQRLVKFFANILEASGETRYESKLNFSRYRGGRRRAL